MTGVEHRSFRPMCRAGCIHEYAESSSPVLLRCCLMAISSDSKNCSGACSFLTLKHLFIVDSAQFAGISSVIMPKYDDSYVESRLIVKLYANSHVQGFKIIFEVQGIACYQAGSLVLLQEFREALSRHIHRERGAADVVGDLMREQGRH